MGKRKPKSDPSSKDGGNESGNRKKDLKMKSEDLDEVEFEEEEEPMPIDPNQPSVKMVNESSFEKLPGIFTLSGLTEVLYTPCPPSSLAVARIFFGLMMVIDIPDERGLFDIDIRFGNPMKCHFPLFDWITPLPLEYMGLIYFIMWLGAAGICLGYRYRTSCIMFALPYWYIFLLDKTTWNNHSYLYGLLSILFTFCSANHDLSLDSKLNPYIKDQPVPFWNYAILRFQFFLLYFYAGVKKLDLDWIGGHSMTRLSLHWVFDPFRPMLTDEQIDFWIIHIFGFLFDLTVGFFLLIESTRPMAIFFSTAFHLMNSRLFHIGQFPYVCLAMIPIFCSYDWPYRIWEYLKWLYTKREKAPEFMLSKSTQTPATNLWQKFTTCLLAFYVVLQLFLPFSHFITKGYNNWTNGLYGYSWDMMVHNWDSVLTVIKVVDNDSGEEVYIDPEAWVVNSRFTQHGDMLVQYAGCLKRNLPQLPASQSDPKPRFQNISVYIDVWCSLNGRFQQRMFDPRQDLLKAEWSPFKKVHWLMPLLSDLTHWRDKMTVLEKKITGKSTDTGVLFVADFPGLYLNNYIVPELKNVQLTVLQGSVVLEKRVKGKDKIELINKTLNEGDADRIHSGQFHKVYTISSDPSCYMYTFVNDTLRDKDDFKAKTTLRDYDNFANNFKFRLDNLFDSLMILRRCFNKLLFNIPIQIRTN